MIETTHSLKGKKYIYENPKARADDLMEALSNPKIKAIFMNLGGDDAIRILPYIDFQVIKEYPKIFMGFSDATTVHFMFMKAGVSFFSGPNFLTTLSEPVHLHEYTEKWIRRALFSTESIGVVEPTETWTNEQIDWDNGYDKERKMSQNIGYEVLQGKGKIQGRLIGGTAGPLAYMIKGTELFHPKDVWEKSILFLDGMSPYAPVLSLRHALRGLAAAGIFDKANGLLISKPVQNDQYKQIKDTVLQVVRDEVDRTDLPILFNVDFGHMAPMNILPYGAMAEIDCDTATFRILESGVVD